MKIDFRNLIQSKTFKYTLWGIGGLLVILVSFKAGEFMGVRKASFSYQWGEGYYRSVMGRGRSMLGRGLDEKDFLAGHGIAGPIIKISSSTLTIQDRDGIEKIILLGNETVVRQYHNTISSGDLSVGEVVAVIGSPNTTGQIDAKLIRVLPSPSASSSTTEIPNSSR